MSHLAQLFSILTSSTLACVTFYFLEIVAGKRQKRSRNDLIIDLSTIALPDILVHPLIVYMVVFVISAFWPNAAGALADTPVWIQFVAFLILEDMVNYWFHRAAHTFPKHLWPLHLAHHTPSYMSASIVHRNSLVYNLLFPNLYFAAALVYLGFGDTFVWYAFIKNVVLAGAHSELRWDAFLYRHKVLSPLAWVIERTISTPATHFAHHAEVEDDGIGHYNGNYCNLMFLWDVLFGTARITRKYPPSFGVALEPGQTPVPWYVQLFYPIVTRPRESTEAVIASDRS